MEICYLAVIPILASIMRRMSSRQRSKSSSVKHERLREEDEEKNDRPSRPPIDKDEETQNPEQVPASIFSWDFALFFSYVQIKPHYGPGI